MPFVKHVSYKYFLLIYGLLLKGKVSCFVLIRSNIPCFFYSLIFLRFFFFKVPLPNPMSLRFSFKFYSKCYVILSSYIWVCVFVVNFCILKLYMRRMTSASWQHKPTLILSHSQQQKSQHLYTNKSGFGIQGHTQGTQEQSHPPVS